MRPLTIRHLAVLLISVSLVGILGLQCGPGGPDVIPTPTRTRPALALATNTPTPLPPTETPPTPPQDTPTSPPPAETATPVPTARPPSPAPPSASATAIARPPLPPQEGGEWDMEAGFVPGSSPLGEDCPGGPVATGWTAFLAPTTPPHPVSTRTSILVRNEHVISTIRILLVKLSWRGPVLLHRVAADHGMLPYRETTQRLDNRLAITREFEAREARFPFREGPFRPTLQFTRIWSSNL